MRTSNWKGFQSPLAEPIKKYLEYKRALCKKYISQEQSLRVFDAYLVNAGLTSIEQVTPLVVNAFLRSRPSSRPKTHNQLTGALRRFFEWMASQGILNISLLQLRKRRATDDLKPCILSHDEVKKLLVMAGELRDDTSNARGRSRKYQMIFALAYGLGLRVGEISRLEVGDIDFDRAVMTIKQSKFCKTRVLPLGPILAQQLKGFLVKSGRHEDSDPVFSALDDKRAMSKNTITVVFHQLVLKLGIKTKAGERSPRLHDLRHSFAVNTLLRFYREGKDPNQQLLLLSTFLGHSKLQHTAVYLTMTDELLSEANGRFHKFASVALQEVAL